MENDMRSSSIDSGIGSSSGGTEGLSFRVVELLAAAPVDEVVRSRLAEALARRSSRSSLLSSRMLLSPVVRLQFEPPYFEQIQVQE